MSYYGNESTTTETDASFADPSADLEVQADGDDPNGDLGDGMRRRKRMVESDDWNIGHTQTGQGW